MVIMALKVGLGYQGQRYILVSEYPYTGWHGFAMHNPNLAREMVQMDVQANRPYALVDMAEKRVIARSGI